MYIYISPMLYFNFPNSKTNRFLSVLIVLSMLFIYSCTESTTPVSDKNVSMVHKETGFVCMDIQGHVLGDINPGSEVFLFKLQKQDYDTVMNTVRMSTPVQTGIVNGTAGFNFTCLSYGQYVAAIPSTSYRNSSVGSPLVYEFRNESVSIDIVFQGGDHEYLVGAFSINKTHQALP